MSWGFAVTTAAADAGEALANACREHFDATHEAIEGMAVTDRDGNPVPALLEEQQIRRDEMTAGIEQAAAAVEAARALAAAGHIDQVTISVTGHANAAHAPDGPQSLSARIIIGLVRA